MSRVWRAGSILLVGCVFLGCTSVGSGPAPDGNPKAKHSLAPLAGGEPPLDPAIVAAADPNKAPRPLAAFLSGSESVRLVSRARLIVGNKCMRGFGFQPDPSWQPEDGKTRLDWSRYGLWDASVAATRGYESPPVGGANQTPLRFLTPDAIFVYLGNVKDYHGQKVPDGGCQGEEYRAIFSGTQPHVDPHYLENLDEESLQRSEQDSRVTRLIGEWKSCMKSAGWDFADVRAPLAYWTSRRGNDPQRAVISDEELRSARTDLDCKRSTKLLGTWLAADIAYQRAIVEREGEGLREYVRVADAMLTNANRIIAAG